MIKDILFITPWIISLIIFSFAMISIQLLLTISYHMSQIFSKIIVFVNK